MLMIRFKLSITPWMLPPCSRLMTGNRVWSNTSPVTSTSERRKNTMLSPSLCAAGW